MTSFKAVFIGLFYFLFFTINSDAVVFSYLEKDLGWPEPEEESAMAISSDTFQGVNFIGDSAKYKGAFLLASASGTNITQPWIPLLLLNDSDTIPDSTPPVVVSTVPADGETDVAVTAFLSVSFSEPMDPATINENTFFLRYGEFGAFFSGTLSYSGVTAKFAPAGMPFDALLTATTTTGVKDLAGNGLASNYTWSFKTALPPLGNMDTTFGAAGKVITDISGAVTGDGIGDAVKSLLIQPDGKIVAAGTSYAGILNLNDFALARYNANGSLDTTFGASGKVMTDFEGDDYLRGAAMQSDGKIIVAGASFLGCCGNLVLARYNTDGNLDATFGTDGKVSTDLGGNDSPFGLGIRTDDKILLSAGNSSSSFLVQYDSNGTLDETFGEGGIVPIEFGGYLAIQTDGKIVLASTMDDYDFGLARYNPDGTLDTTFGSGGFEVTDFGFNDYVHAIALAPDGKIVVAGWSWSDQYRIALARYNTNGMIDETFGEGGKVVTDFGGLSGSSASAVSVQPD